jgi:hypothetical protein
MNIATSSLQVAQKGINSRRHLRLVRGKFQRAISGLSTDLQDSALRTFDRIAKTNGCFARY